MARPAAQERGAPAPPEGYELVETPWGQKLWQRIEPTTQIKFGWTGYYMEVDGMCLEAAVATVLQRPLDSIPRMSTQTELAMWAFNSEGLECEPSDGPQFGPMSIGFVRGSPLSEAQAAHYGAASAGHTVVLLGTELIFDPASRFMTLDGRPSVRPSGTPQKPIVSTVTLFKERS